MDYISYIIIAIGIGLASWVAIKQKSWRKDENKKRQARRILLFVVILLLGVSIIIFGGYDDSPGAQGIGLLIILIGFWKLIIRKKIWPRKTKE